MEEIWKDVIGYEGLYQVSSLGRVKSLKRIVERSNGIKRTVPERILKHGFDGLGYPIVVLCKDGKRKTIHIHKLIQIAFSIGDVDIHHIDHIDRNRQNNHLSNLRAVTHRQNHQNRTKKSKLPVGVYFDKPSGKYKAQIHIDGNTKYLGLFTCPNKASEAYQSKLKELDLVFISDL